MKHPGLLSLLGSGRRLKPGFYLWDGTRTPAPSRGICTSEHYLAHMPPPEESMWYFGESLTPSSFSDYGINLRPHGFYVNMTEWVPVWVSDEA